VKFVPVRSIVFGFEVIQQVKFLQFPKEEEILCEAQSWNESFMLRGQDFLHFNMHLNIMKEDFYV